MEPENAGVLDDENDSKVHLMDAVQCKEMAGSSSDEEMQDEQQLESEEEEEQDESKIHEELAENETGGDEDQEKVTFAAVIDNKEMEDASTYVTGKRSALEDIAVDAKKARVDHENTPGMNTEPERLNTPFVERKEELEKLNYLMRTKVNSSSLDVAISGLPGVGKTELVRQFIDQNIFEFENIIWFSEDDQKESDRFIKKLKIFYEILNEETTLVIFENVFISDLADYMPSKEKRGNIMIIATSQIADIPCDLNIPLQCFTPQNSLQYLQNNIPDENIEDLMSLSEILNEFPLALETAVKYFKHHTKIWEIDQKKFTVQDLILDIKNKTAQFLHFKTESDLKTSNLASSLHSMLDKSMISISNENDISIQLLKCMSYMDHSNIDIQMFYSIGNATVDIDSAMKVLQKYSLINVVDGKKIKILPIIQSIVRDLSDKASVLLKIAHFLDNSMIRIIPTDDELKDKILLQVANLFDDFVAIINNSDEWHHYITIFDWAIIGSPSEQYEKYVKLYSVVMKCTGPREMLSYKCNYLCELYKLEKYQDVVDVSSQIIKQNYDNDFDCSEVGLNIWYNRALAFFRLNQLEKSWIICKNTYHLFAEKFSLPIDAYKTSFDLFEILKLQTKIAIEIKKKDSNSDKLDLCLDIVEHLFSTFIDWTEFKFREPDLDVLSIITKYYFDIKNPEFAVKYLQNIKLKLEKQIKSTVTDDLNEANNIQIYLKLKIIKCLYKMNDMNAAYNILYALLPEINDDDKYSQNFLFCTKITCKLEGEIKLDALIHCLETMHVIILDNQRNCSTHFVEYFKCFMLIESHISNSEMISQYMRLLSHFEKCVSDGDEIVMKLCLIKLQRAMITCRHLCMNDAWDIYRDACQSFKEPLGVNYKPVEKTNMLVIIETATSMALVKVIYSDMGI